MILVRSRLAQLSLCRMAMPSLPNTDSLSADDYKKERISKIVKKKLLHPPNTIYQGRMWHSFRVRVPLAQVSHCAVTLAPCRVNELLVSSSGTNESESRTSVAGLRRSYFIYHDVVGVDDMSTQQHSTGLVILIIQLPMSKDSR
jgi:hypothetical protein